jgi:hypothetical protein
MKNQEEIKEVLDFLTTKGYIKKIEDLRNKKTSVGGVSNLFGIKVMIATEIIPEVVAKLGKNPNRIKNIIDKILG